MDIDFIDSYDINFDTVINILYYSKLFEHGIIRIISFTQFLKIFCVVEYFQPKNVDMQNHTGLLYDLVSEYCKTLTKKNCCLDDINIDMICSANIHNDYKTNILHKFIKKTNKVNLDFRFEMTFIGTANLI